MLNEAFDAIESVLEDLDVGGEQSRQFAAEIQLLRRIIGYPDSTPGNPDESQRRKRIAHHLRRLAVQADGLTASLPTLEIGAWLDSSRQDQTVHVDFADYDLPGLLRFIADVGVGRAE